MDIEYKIHFFSNWHCGSGLSAGADVDALVVKDSDGLPYVPGRTVKGLLREAAEELYGKTDILNKVFGDKENTNDTVRTGTAFFSNATIPGGATIVKDGLQQYLYQDIATTAIEDDGIAKDHSLRKTQTVVPLTVKGQIQGVPDEAVEILRRVIKYIKRMGTGRTRGLGRCKIEMT